MLPKTPVSVIDGLYPYVSFLTMRTTFNYLGEQLDKHVSFVENLL